MELILPVTGKSVLLEPMRAREEKMLTDKKLVKKNTNVDAVLGSCVREMDAKKPTEKDLLDLPSGDRNFLLYHLRILSYGPEFESRIFCPHCRKESEVLFDLEELLEHGQIEVRRPTSDGLEKDITLSTGVVATVAGLNGHMERRLKGKGDDMTTVDLVMASLRALDGESVTAAAVDELAGRDLAAIRKAAREVTFGLVPKVDVECEHCDRKIEFILTASQDFFLR